MNMHPSPQIYALVTAMAALSLLDTPDSKDSATTPVKLSKLVDQPYLQKVRV